MKGNKYKMLILTVFCMMLATTMTVTAQVPDWATGTFTARNPQTGGTIILTIERNGNVTANLDGAVSSGNYNDKRLTINGVTSKVKRLDNGIRTTRNDNGERIDYTRGGNSGGGGNGNVPDWAVGTFTARNPQSGGTITLTIDRNGYVTANLDGTVNNGNYNDGRITINGVSSDVRRDGSGLRTTRTDNGERIDYVRSGGNGGGNGGNVPSWAVGRFYASNPQNGEVIGITIESSGSVTVNFNGAVSYGTMNDDRLTINGVTSKVKRLKNGIRTTRTDNGERIDYITQAR